MSDSTGSQLVLNTLIRRLRDELVDQEMSDSAADQVAAGAVGNYVNGVFDLQRQLVTVVVIDLFIDIIQPDADARRADAAQVAASPEAWGFVKDLVRANGVVPGSRLSVGQ